VFATRIGEIRSRQWPGTRARHQRGNFFLHDDPRGLFEGAGSPAAGPPVRRNQGEYENYPQRIVGQLEGTDRGAHSPPTRKASSTQASES